MDSLAERDYFSDHEILKDPYAYFEAIRAKGPIHQLANGIVVVTGFDEILDVLKNTEDFSSTIAPQGPAAALPFAPQGADITPQIEEHRTSFIGGDLLVAYDGSQHSQSRALLSRLFTPSRLKANEQFIAEMVAKGQSVDGLYPIGKKWQAAYQAWLGDRGRPEHEV